MSIDATVIIPTTGTRPDLLLRALASVREQRSRPREVIVVVDGSQAVADSVRASINDASLDPVSVLCTGQRRGASAARNFGSSGAAGFFLCFLDDDDRWKSSYLERVFADGHDFDLALTGFEKHTPHGVYPEKIPARDLKPACFVQTNPGIRGSNIVVRACVYASVRGFDEGLVSFNDVDFGARVFEVPNLRYRAVREPLVEYHAHDGERLSKRGSSSVAPGIQQFLARYEASMSTAEHAAFRERAIRNWDIDPWIPTMVLERLQQPSTDAAPLVRALDERVLEALDHGDAEVDRALDAVEELCVARARLQQPGIERLRLAVISTEGSSSLVSLLESLSALLRRSHWRPRESADDAIEALVLENDAQPRSDRDRRAVIDAASRVSVRVRFVRAPAAGEVLSTARARAALFRAIREQGWIPSRAEPVWVLDDDLRFEQLLPSCDRGFRTVLHPSLLHRMELLIARHPRADALICGNSGAAPVPALGLVEPQLRDLRQRPQHVLWRPGEAREAMLSGGRYYGFAQDPSDAPRPWRCAWWREDRSWQWPEIEARLRKGLPVTRPALAVQSASRSCWGPFDPPRVAGGNTILLSPRALVAEWFDVVRCGAIESRRADSVWCHRARRAGVDLVQVSIPLLHDRAPRGDGTTDNLVRDAVSDAIGVGLYRAIEEGQPRSRARVSAIARERLAQACSSVRSCIALLDRSDTPLQISLAPTLREVSQRLAEAPLDAIEW